MAPKPRTQRLISSVPETVNSASTPPSVRASTAGSRASRDSRTYLAAAGAKRTLTVGRLAVPEDAEGRGHVRRQVEPFGAVERPREDLDLLDPVDLVVLDPPPRRVQRDQVKRPAMVDHAVRDGRRGGRLGLALGAVQEAGLLAVLDGDQERVDQLGLRRVVREADPGLMEGPREPVEVLRGRPGPRAARIFWNALREACQKNVPASGSSSRRPR